MSGAEVLGLLSAILTVIDASVKLTQAVGDTSGLPDAFRGVLARLPLVHDTLATILEEEKEKEKEADALLRENDGSGNGAGAPISSSLPLRSSSSASISALSPPPSYSFSLSSSNTTPSSTTATATTITTTSSSSSSSMTPILQSCKDKATALNKVLQSVMPAAGAGRRERLAKALLTLPSADKVESLMEGILRDLQVVTSNHAVKGATRAQVERLVDEVRRSGGGVGGLKEEREKESGGSDVVGWKGGAEGGGVVLYNNSVGSQYVNTGRSDQNIVTGKGVQINGSCAGPIYFGRM